MADGAGELQSLKKSKKSKSRASSKKSSIVGSEKGDGDLELELQLRQLEGEENAVEEDLGKLEEKDAHSAALHRRAMEGKIEFLEDWNVPDNLEQEDVWKKVKQDHEKEEGLLDARLERMRR